MLLSRPTSDAISSQEADVRYQIVPSSLTAILGADVVGDDLMTVWDTSAGELKSITIVELIVAIAALS